MIKPVQTAEQIFCENAPYVGATLARNPHREYPMMIRLFRQNWHVSTGTPQSASEAMMYMNYIRRNDPKAAVSIARRVRP